MGHLGGDCGGDGLLDGVSGVWIDWDRWAHGVRRWIDQPDLGGMYNSEGMDTEWD